MSFADFKGIWTVTASTEGEETGHRVAIGGNADAVKILCIDKEASHVFPVGSYEPSPEERIRLDSENRIFHITLHRGDPNKIECRPDTEGPGSWTADDSVGDGGHGHGHGHGR